jgi:menaquinone-dependent protoporphyrinogen oxidase
MNVLLLHQGVYGHTRRICEHLQDSLCRAGHEARVVALSAGVPDLARYDAIVIGASIRHGKHNPAVLEYVRAHLAQLESTPSAFFSVSLVARKATRNTPQTNPYVQAFLASSPWKPRLVGVFAGELDYNRYGAFDRNVIRLIMRITGGPTARDTRVVFTDWKAVDRFAAQVATLAAVVASA